MVQNSPIAEWSGIQMQFQYRIKKLSGIQMVSLVFKWWFEYQTFHHLNTGLLKVCNSNGSVIQMSGIWILTVQSIFDHNLFGSTQKSRTANKLYFETC